MRFIDFGRARDFHGCSIHLGAVESGCNQPPPTTRRQLPILPALSPATTQQMRLDHVSANISFHNAACAKFSSSAADLIELQYGRPYHHP
jgi:hypothetical protein